MIYAISGPPRTGKSTLARIVRQRAGPEPLSTDALWAATQAIIPQAGWAKQLPLAALRQNANWQPDRIFAKTTVLELVEAYAQDAQTCWPAIAKSCEFFLARHESVVVEGSLLRPVLMQALADRLAVPLQAVVLARLNVGRAARDLQSHRTTPDWLVDKIYQAATFNRATQLIVGLGRSLAAEALTVNWPVISVDEDFDQALDDAETILCGRR